MLNFAEVALRRGGRLLFESPRIQLHPGWKVALTGRNGCGKSSLFALILGELEADHGGFSRPADWVVAQVAQQTPSGSRAALEFVLDGDAELRVTEAELAAAERAGDGHRIGELHARLDAIGGYAARSRAGRILDGLGFRPDELERPLDRFSGGWRMRLNLARALMCRSDLLLLDEPTNHLDLDAVIWLERWLAAYPGTLLLISHDRDFLNGVTGHTLNIEQGRLTLYPGNYDQFERIRAERLAAQQSAHARQQQEIAEIRRFVDRFRAKATKARQAQSRLRSLERMELILPAHADSPFRFMIPRPEKNPHPLLGLDRAAAGYGGRAVIERVRLVVAPGDRIALLGPNGAGKSTLMKLLAGLLPPLDGERRPAQDLVIGYFAQHNLEQLDPQATPVEHLQRLDRAVGEQAARDFLGRFGFGDARALEPVAPLSGGEKARLALALVIFRRPNLLLLDEPTNHLDIEMRLALNQALQQYAGALVLVSHDRHLIRTCCDRLLLVADRRVDDFEGAIDDYPAWLDAHRAAARPQPPAEPDKAHGADARRAQRRDEAERRRRLQPLRRALERREAEAERIAGTVAALEQQLADPALYEPAQKARLQQLLLEKAALDRRLAEAEAAWLEAGEVLAEAEDGLRDGAPRVG